MTGVAGKRLVFRLSGVGFSLAIGDLLEILEAREGILDTSAADADLALLGLLSVRDEAIHARDVHGLFRLSPGDFASAILVVAGADGAWGLLADRVEGIFPLESFCCCEVPPLLQEGVSLPFTAIELWQGEPLICFDPKVVDQWLGSA
jgi:chemotaxis signal transduction protein